MNQVEKAIVCFSGGHSSALAAIEAVRRYGKDKVILLNHDMSPKVEHEDIKRFKREVADYYSRSRGSKRRRSGSVL